MRVLIEEYGPEEFVRRLADPVWFQSLGTVLAFDWNASGLTTILTAALKEAARGQEEEFGIFICGGKGKTSLKTPEQIVQWSEKIAAPGQKAKALVYASKMSAKVDSSLIQDGFSLYHHSFIFSKDGSWTVVQQGMNTEYRAARRYHWYMAPETAVKKDTSYDTGRQAVENKPPAASTSESKTADNNKPRSGKSFIEEPHSGIASQVFKRQVLNLTDRKSAQSRCLSVEFVQAGFNSIKKDLEILRKHSTCLSKMVSLRSGSKQLTLLKLSADDFHCHPVVDEDFSKSRYLEKILSKLSVQKPESYEQLLITPGVGPKTIRALALIAEVIYGAEVSYKDPARYSFAHGGKDAIPYPVDKETYDKTIAILKYAVNRAKISPYEKIRALRELEKRNFE